MGEPKPSELEASLDSSSLNNNHHNYSHHV